MTRHREELDDTIDRVAAAITFVPGDPALAARVAARIGDSPHVLAWWHLAAGAVAMAAVVLAGIVVTNSRRESVDAPAVTIASPAPTATPLAKEPAAPVAALEVMSATASRPVRLTVQRSVVLEPEVPQIDALSSPAPLEMDDVVADPLTIAPVDLAPLDLANLAVGELDDRADPKE